MKVRIASFVLLFLAGIGSSMGFAADPPEPMNEIISDLVDNPEKYKGKTITLELVWRGGGVGQTLRNDQSDKFPTLFRAVDPKNDAELLLKVLIPKKLTVPAVKYKESVIVTFECQAGDRLKGNVATAARRP